MPLKVASVLARVASPYALWAIRARVSAGFTIISLTVAPPFKRQSRQAITKCVYRVVKNLQQAVFSRVQELKTNLEVMIWSSLKSFINTLHINDLAAPQGFEPRYADPESAVLPLNEGAAKKLVRADDMDRLV